MRQLVGALRTTGIGIPIAPRGYYVLERAFFRVSHLPRFANQGVSAPESLGAFLLFFGGQ
jgi:hypothetical protein